MMPKKPPSKRVTPPVGSRTRPVWMRTTPTGAPSDMTRGTPRMPPAKANNPRSRTNSTVTSRGTGAGQLARYGDMSDVRQKQVTTGRTSPTPRARPPRITPTTSTRARTSLDTYTRQNAANKAADKQAANAAIAKRRKAANSITPSRTAKPR